MGSTLVGFCGFRRKERRTSTTLDRSTTPVQVETFGEAGYFVSLLDSGKIALQSGFEPRDGFHRQQSKVANVRLGDISRLHNVTNQYQSKRMTVNDVNDVLWGD